MKEPSKNKSADTDWEIDIQSCSATDCTGLIPALPESDAELEHYQDLYHYLPDEKKMSPTFTDHICKMCIHNCIIRDFSFRNFRSVVQEPFFLLIRASGNFSRCTGNLQAKYDQIKKEVQQLC